MMAAKALDDEIATAGLVAVGDHRNDVVLIGRVTTVAQERDLPSGDLMVTWRIVVDRPPQTRVDGRRLPTIDTLDCFTRRKSVSRSALAWQLGDTVEVAGSLRRRFWQGPTRRESRVEVEVLHAKRLHKAA